MVRPDLAEDAVRNAEPRRGRASGVRRAALILALLLAAVGAIPATRHAVLRALGSALVVADAIEAADVVVISESGGSWEFLAAEIDASDLYQRHQVSQVVVLKATPNPIDLELARRGVKIEDVTISILRQLGVPDGAIVTLEAGEGGTLESTRALASWARARPARVLVIIGAAHARRYRRTLLRVWPAEVPAPRVTYPRRTPFTIDAWWTTRRTLREGLFELEKLAWDSITHPW